MSSSSSSAEIATPKWEEWENKVLKANIPKTAIKKGTLKHCPYFRLAPIAEAINKERKARGEKGERTNKDCSKQYHDKGYDKRVWTEKDEERVAKKNSSPQESSKSH